MAIVVSQLFEISHLTVSIPLNVLYANLLRRWNPFDAYEEKDKKLKLSKTNITIFTPLKD